MGMGGRVYGGSRPRAHSVKGPGGVPEADLSEPGTKALALLLPGVKSNSLLSPFARTSLAGA